MVVLGQSKDMPTPIDVLVQKPSPTHPLGHSINKQVWCLPHGLWLTDNFWWAPGL